MKASNVKKNSVVRVAASDISNIKSGKKTRIEAIKERTKWSPKDELRNKWAAAAVAVEKKIEKEAKLANRKTRVVSKSLKPRVIRSGVADEAVTFVPERIKNHLNKCCPVAITPIVTVTGKASPAVFVISANIRAHLNECCDYFKHSNRKLVSCFNLLGGSATIEEQVAMGGFVNAGAFKNARALACFGAPVVTPAIAITKNVAITKSENAPAYLEKPVNRKVLNALANGAKRNMKEIQEFLGTPGTHYHKELKKLIIMGEVAQDNERRFYIV
jgi:hypothetical protein